MARTNLNDVTLKQALKQAVAEALQEQRELLHEVFADVLEDFALAEAIHQGRQTKPATRAEVSRILQGKP